MSEPTEDGSSFPACQISLTNPAGAMLVLRSSNVEGLVDQLNQIWDGHVGKRTDLTNLYLFSFNPAIVADMRAGRSAEEAMGYEPDELATAAYDALTQGATRAPAAANGGPRPASSKGAGKFTVEDVGEGNLPAYFIDVLTRNNLCPECRDPEGLFWDNRESKKTGKEPDFRCANQSCDAGKGYPWAVWEEQPERGRRGSARTR